MAAANGLEKIVRLLKCRAPKLELCSTDSLGRSALHLAALRGHVAVVRELMNRGSSLEDDLSEPQRVLSPDDVHRMVEQYLPSGDTVLHIAARAGYCSMMAEFLACGSCTKILHKVDRNDRTALHLAAECGRLRIVKLLVPEMIKSEGEDALLFATQACRRDVVEYLTDMHPPCLTGRSLVAAFDGRCEDIVSIFVRTCARLDEAHEAKLLVGVRECVLAAILAGRSSIAEKLLDLTPAMKGGVISCALQ